MPCCVSPKGSPLKLLAVLCLAGIALGSRRPANAAARDRLASRGAQDLDLLAGFEPSRSQVSRERAGEVIVRHHDGPGQTLEIVQGQTLVHAPARIVWTVITDYADYPRLFPRIARSEIRDVKGRQEHYTDLRYPWPYRRRWVLNAIHADRRHWTLRWHRLDGTVRDLIGEWQLRPLGAATLLRYGVQIDPGLPLIPTWAIEWGTRIVTPEILRAVAREAVHRTAAGGDGPAGPAPEILTGGQTPPASAAFAPASFKGGP